MNMHNQDFGFSTIDEISRQIQTKQISPVEVTEMMLKRIEKIEPKLNAFITQTTLLAREQAKQAEKDIVGGNYKGPLHGIPIVHKDLYYTKGIRTTASSQILKNFVPDYDSTAVKNLSDAGVILLGKVQTHEFAAGAFTDSPHFGPCHNPWNLDRVPGGSSGGSGAAVSAGLAFMGTGTDTGGSIRIPAACCGIVGMKPTYGRVSRYGIFPLAWSLDHSGPLTRTVKDAALCLQAMAGYDPKDDSTADIPVPDYASMLREDLKGVRIGIPAEYYFEGIDQEVAAAIQAAIVEMKALGAEVIDAHIPMAKHINATAMSICFSEVAAIHNQWHATRSDEYGEDVRMFIEAGKLIPAPNYLQAQRVRHLIQQDFLEALSKVDVLLTATLPIVAPLIGDKSSGMNLADYTIPTNLTGLPSLAMPCGFSSDGMPISLQLIGKPYAEGEVMGIGNAYEKHTKWHQMHPNLD
jgi:aspartyl-tRNA(Asn)/glutamyl-tRNA(Gln) amidotransferase subunit A